MAVCRQLSLDWLVLPGDDTPRYEAGLKVVGDSGLPIKVGLLFTLQWAGEESGCWGLIRQS